MKKIRAWIVTARLPTLLLSVSGILVGGSLTINSHGFSWIVFLMILMTAISLQILANFANDYGDFVKGTDDEERKGPKRSLQQGLLTIREIKRAISIMIILIIVLSLGFLSISFGLAHFDYFVFIGLILALSIIAALKYTVGKFAYGYSGLGDLSVLLFFGVFSVLGTQFIMSHQISFNGVIWAFIIGLCCVAVLNINNIRDIENDRNKGKITLAVILGIRGAFLYHYLLILSVILAIGYLKFVQPGNHLFQIIVFGSVITLLISNTLYLSRAKKLSKMNLTLKQMSLITFLIGFILFFESLFSI